MREIMKRRLTWAEPAWWKNGTMIKAAIEESSLGVKITR